MKIRIIERTIECTIERTIKRIGEDVIQENTYDRIPIIKIHMIKLVHNRAYNRVQNRVHNRAHDRANNRVYNRAYNNSVREFACIPILTRPCLAEPSYQYTDVNQTLSGRTLH